MYRNQNWLDRYLQAIEKTGDIMLRYAFQKEMMKARFMDEAEIDRIAERVLRRIHIRVEADAISQLRDMLNSLGQ